MGWVHGWVAGCINRAHDLGCITTICDAEQLYTDASTRVAKAAIDLHLHCVVDLMSTLQMGRNTELMLVHMLGLARKLTLRASRGPTTLSSYTQTQRSC